MVVDADSLRALLSGGEVIVRVALPSGACWASLRGVRAARSRGARVVVSVTGVPLEVALEGVLDAVRLAR